MNDRRHLSVRLDDEEYEEYTNAALLLGVKKAALIRRAMEVYLGQLDGEGRHEFLKQERKALH